MLLSVSSGQFPNPLFDLEFLQEVGHPFEKSSIACRHLFSSLLYHDLLLTFPIVVSIASGVDALVLN